MAMKIVKIFDPLVGWKKIPFFELTKGTLFKMYNPMNLEPIIMNGKDRWVAATYPYEEANISGLVIKTRPYIVLVNKFYSDSLKKR